MAIDQGTILDTAARTDNINTDGLPIDMEPMTNLLDPQDTPFVSLTNRVGKPSKATDQMDRKFRERRLRPNYSYATTAVTADNTTSLVVQDPTYFKADMVIVHNETGQQLMVDSVSGSTLTVRQLEGTTGSGNIPQAISVGDRISIGVEAHAEGEEVPAVFSINSTTKTNYVMQSDRRVEATDIEEAVRHYDSSERRKMDQRQAMVEYRRDMNLLGYIGKGTRETTSASGRYRWVCSGMFEQFSENIIDVSEGGPFSIQTLGAIMAQITPHSSSGQKIGLFGQNGWAAISAWPSNALRVTPGENKRWGITLNRIITGFGPLDIGYDPVLNDNHGLADRAIVYDDSKIDQLYLRGLKPRLFRDIKNLSTIHNSVDAISGTFGWQVKLAELHAQIKGL
jgi:hypothetical protein